MASISVEGLAKSFGRVPALLPTSFEVAPGEVFGLIGPDGAGKTTLMRLLVSLLLPDAGSARVDGLDVVKDFRELRRRVGYMPGRFSLYQDLSVRENLDFFATIFGASVAENRGLVDDLYLQLEPFEKRRAGALSGGMKQKLALCCALIHRPRVLFLDEPTTGIDAVSRRELWEMLGRLRAAGITLLVSTPYMDEASRCDRVALIEGGRILAIERPGDLAARYRYPLLAVEGGPRIALLEALRSLPQARSVYPFGSTIHFTDQRLGADPAALAAELVGALEGRGLEGLGAQPIEAGIEDVFMALAVDTRQAGEAHHG
ncbi:MAG: ABC transporter ATP-binding protein [Thermoanaerobaculia bacterium]